MDREAQIHTATEDEKPTIRDPEIGHLSQHHPREVELATGGNLLESRNRDVIPSGIDSSFIRAEGVRRGLSQRRELRNVQ